MGLSGCLFRISCKLVGFGPTYCMSTEHWIWLERPKENIAYTWAPDFGRPRRPRPQDYAETVVGKARAYHSSDTKQEKRFRLNVAK